MKLQGHEVELTHLDKILWPRERYTKGDVIQYYASVAHEILAYLKNRPVMVHRYPRGIHHPGFYQKNVEEHPSWIETVAVKHENRTVHYPLIQNKATLLYLANLGCIDFHPLLSPVAHLKRLSYLVLDLDPEDLAFEYVIETALVICDILESAQVKSCCKTSGGRGLHIVIPTAGQLDFTEAKEIVHALALCVQKQLPRLISLFHQTIT